MASKHLKNLSFVVTGANRGIGLEFACQLQENGAHVIATARKPEEAKDLHNHNIRVEALDITNPKSVAQLASRLRGTAIDVLINNAGIGLYNNGFETLNMDDVARQFQVNCIGTLRVIQALLPNLKKGNRKLVLTITSRMGSIQDNKEGAGYGYRASKAALNMLNKNLSIEFGPKGLTFVLLHPGWVRTEMGGPHAPLNPRKSVAGMLKVISRLGPKDNGRFLDFRGKPIPW
jgi:NAD(P)-dependent dehydrogenase (short-subunit alcohol dehydrogenase family)